MPHDDDMAEHIIWHLVWDRCQALDAVGPFEVFAATNRVAAELASSGPIYVQQLVAPTGASVITESGLELNAASLDELVGAPDTLLLPGGDGVYDVAADPAVVDWVRKVGAEAERLAMVCTGTFLAAEAGLLDGHRVTTHWARRDRLAAAHPSIDVDADAIHLRSGRVWSSAGVTAGMDLALAIVEHDHEARVAQIVARWLVIHLRRPGGQSQYAAPVWFSTSNAEPVGRAQQLIAADPSADLSVDRLAAHVGLSPRHLARLFQAEVGCTPAKYVEQVRLATARSELERTEAGLAEIARRAGFGTAETLRRVFQRHLGVPPDTYRQRFALTPS